MDIQDYTKERFLEFLLKAKKELDVHSYVTLQNDLKQMMHENSPFKNEPVDFVKWVKNDNVVANDYNPRRANSY